MNPSQTWQLVRQAVSDFFEDKAPRLGAALAYYTVFSLAPLLVITIAIAGAFLGPKVAQGQIVEQLEGMVGADATKVIVSMIASTRKPGGTLIATLTSVAVLVFAASGVFAQLKDALNTVWEVPAQRGGGVGAVVWSRLIAVLMVIAVGVLLLGSLLTSTALTATAAFASNLLPVPSYLLRIADIVISLAVMTLLFAMIFKLLPDERIAWGDVWIGAGVTAVLFTLGKLGIGWYLGRNAVSSTYGAAGSVVVILLWTYYSAMILLLGAEFTQAYASRYGSRPGSGLITTGAPVSRIAGVLKETTAKSASGQEGEAMETSKSELEFLQDEADQAHAAIRQTLGELTSRAATAASPSSWTRAYPWAAIGIAAVVGAAAGKFLLPTREPAVLASSRDRAARKGDYRRRSRSESGAGGSEPDERRGMLAVLLGGLGGVLASTLRTAIQSAIVTAVSAKTAARAVETEAPDESSRRF